MFPILFTWQLIPLSYSETRTRLQLHLVRLNYNITICISMATWICKKEAVSKESVRVALCKNTDVCSCQPSYMTPETSKCIITLGENNTVRNARARAGQYRARKNGLQNVISTTQAGLGRLV